MPRDAAAPGADRRTNRNLAPAAGRANEQQVGDVRARDQQHEADRARQDQQRRLNVPHQHLLHPLDAEGLVRPERGGKLRAVILGGELQPRTRLLQRDARLQPSGDRKVMALIRRLRIDLKRSPQLRLEAEALDVEARPEDADDGVRLAAEHDGPADDSRVAAEPARPQPVAHDDDMRRARTILLFGERAAAKDRRAEQPEEVGAHLPSAKLLRRVAGRVVDDVAAERRHVLDDVSLLTPVDELGRRGGRPRALRRRVLEVDDAAWIGRRDWLEEHGIDNGKDSRVHADAERERRNRGERERGRLEERPNRVPQVPQHRIHLALLLARAGAAHEEFRHVRRADGWVRSEVSAWVAFTDPRASAGHPRSSMRARNLPWPSPRPPSCAAHGGIARGRRAIGRCPG